MRSGTVIGAGAGFAGGIVAAFVLSILGIKGHEGQITRAITLVSHTVHTDSLVSGWLVQIAVATAIGALFGVLYTAAGLRRESAAFWATIYGLAWWIVGWFAVMPPPLRFAPWAAARIRRCSSSPSPACSPASPSARRWPVPSHSSGFPKAGTATRVSRRRARLRDRTAC
jgi:hypothetical protein